MSKCVHLQDPDPAPLFPVIEDPPTPTCGKNLSEVVDLLLYALNLVSRIATGVLSLSSSNAALKRFTSLSVDSIVKRPEMVHLLSMR